MDVDKKNLFVLKNNDIISNSDISRISRTIVNLGKDCNCLENSHKSNGGGLKNNLIRTSVEETRIVSIGRIRVLVFAVLDFGIIRVGEEGNVPMNGISALRIKNGKGRVGY